MQVAIYARVSDDKKKSDGERRQDIGRQVGMLKGYYVSKGISEQDIGIYSDDGKSAFTEDWNSRPAFKRLLNDCRRHYVTEFAVEDMTRFSRRLDLGLPLLRELGTIGTHLVSLKEGEIEVTSSRGWLQSTMLLMFAEWDSRVKSEKVKSGMSKAKSLGKHIGRRKAERGSILTPPFEPKKDETFLLSNASLLPASGDSQ